MLLQIKLLRREIGDLIVLLRIDDDGAQDRLLSLDGIWHFSNRIQFCHEELHSLS